MYESFFGLSGSPFSLLPDADFLYLSECHQRTINMLEYGIITQVGFTVISGEIGSGKTTLIRHYLKQADPDVVLGIISNSGMFCGRLLPLVSSAFGLDTSQGEVESHNQFIDFLLAQYAKGKRAVLIVDEAQNLTAEMLEELRIISNVNCEKDPLLQVVLVGQPTLLHTLRRPDLVQLVQRIAVHCHLDPLGPMDTAAYIRHRLDIVDGSPHIFDDLVCASVYYFTGGIPRLINMLCDQAMMHAYSDDLPQITYRTVIDVVADRNRLGVSAFRDIPEGWATSPPPIELMTLVKD